MNQFDSYASDGLRASGRAGGYLSGTSRELRLHARQGMYLLVLKLELELGLELCWNRCGVFFASPSFLRLALLLLRFNSCLASQCLACAMLVFVLVPEPDGINAALFFSGSKARPLFFFFFQHS